MMNEIVFHDYGGASTVARIMMESGYVVMMSREENLYIVNYIWSEHCNRNDVVFQSREDYEEEMDKLCADMRADYENSRTVNFDYNNNQKETVEKYLQDLARKQRDRI